MNCLKKEKDEEVIEDQEETKETSETIENKENTESKDLEEKYEASQKEIEELKDRLVRRQAEFENYKKRTNKEKQDIVTYASEGMIVELLPILDNFERALEVEVDEKSKSLYEGVEMVYNQLLQKLQNDGLEEIECLNEKFDHNCHHAVVQQDSEDCEPDTVIQVLEKGYKYKDKVVRPSMVMTSK